MRKIVALILVLLFVLGLCGCGKVSDGASSEAVSSESQTTLKGDEFEKPEGYTAVLEVKINPQFKLYLDDNNKVLAVEPLNDDAKTVWKDIESQEDNFEKVIHNILAGSKENGFVKANAVVEFEMTEFMSTILAISDVLNKADMEAKETATELSLTITVNTKNGTENKETSSEAPTEETKPSSKENTVSESKPSETSKPKESSSGSNSSKNKDVSNSTSSKETSISKPLKEPSKEVVSEKNTEAANPKEPLVSAPIDLRDEDTSSEETRYTEPYYGEPEPEKSEATPDGEVSKKPSSINVDKNTSSKKEEIYVAEDKIDSGITSDMITSKNEQVNAGKAPDRINESCVNDNHPGPIGSEGNIKNDTHEKEEPPRAEHTTGEAPDDGRNTAAPPIDILPDTNIEAN